MKNIVFIISIAFVAFGCASTGPVPDPTVVRVIDTRVSAPKAFDLSMRWVAQAFRSFKSVVEYSDKAAGTINAKGTVDVPGGLGLPVQVHFSLIIDLKDNRARLSFTALRVTVTGVTSPGSIQEAPVSPMIFERFVSEAEALANQYAGFMAKEFNDW